MENESKSSTLSPLQRAAVLAGVSAVIVVIVNQAATSVYWLLLETRHSVGAFLIATAMVSAGIVAYRDHSAGQAAVKGFAGLPTFLIALGWAALYFEVGECTSRDSYIGTQSRLMSTIDRWYGCAAGDGEACLSKSDGGDLYDTYVAFRNSAICED